MGRFDFDRYDWMCCQYYGRYYIDIGLRPTVDTSDYHYTAIMLDELTARTDGAILPAAYCSHAPVVSANVLNHTVKAGATVNLAGSASDPDGDELNTTW